VGSPEENKKVVAQIVEAYNNRDRDGCDASFADPLVAHAGDGDLVMTHDQHWEEWEKAYATFPDHEATILGMIAEDDHVYLYWTYSGTHLGKDWRGVEPTGKYAEWRAFVDYRLEDGKVVEAWEIHDNLEMYLQLGVVELPES